MRRALYEYKITGVKTSIKYLERIMNNPDFIEGKYDTHFIEKNQEQLAKSDGCEDCSDMVVIAAFIDYLNKISVTRELKNEFAPLQSRWKKIQYLNNF
jgi:acetyl-CoA carboxylase biotin carboxylase subunit